MLDEPDDETSRSATRPARLAGMEEPAVEGVFQRAKCDS